jgi:hypothetical protein
MRHHGTALIVALLAGFLLSTPANAYISGPPPSFVVPTRDGNHLFVMLSCVPLPKDEGNDAVLPDGMKVKLRERFPSSGLYRIGSNVPLWTIDWYGEEGWVLLSEDGRYAVVLNRFGGGGRLGGSEEPPAKPEVLHW